MIHTVIQITLESNYSVLILSCIPEQEVGVLSQPPGTNESESVSRSTVSNSVIPWTEEPGGLQSTGSQRVDTTERLSTLKALH